MDWARQIDGYCERLGPAFWAEPVNALTNVAFLLAALVMWRRLRGSGLALGRFLVVILAAIGVGSFLFHGYATVWASMADVLPIMLFIVVYLYAANRHFWRLGRWRALGLTAGFVPYAALTVPLFGAIPGLGTSAAYAPVPLLIGIYAVLLRGRAPVTARGLMLGAVLLVISLVFRTLDAPLCRALPVGTHFMWHVLNAAMLGWMIEVYRRHMLAACPVRG